MCASARSVPGGSVSVSSTASRPSRLIRKRPTPDAADRVLARRLRLEARAAARRSGRPRARGAQRKRPAWRRSVCSTLPSGVEQPHLDVGRRDRDARVRAHAPARARSRRAAARRGGRRAARPCSGGSTVALPPPSVRATAAFGPTTATRCSEPPSSGSSAPWLRARTKPAAAVARSSAEISSAGQARGAPPAAAHAVELPDAGGEAQDPQHLVVDRGLADLAGADGRHQRVAPRAVRAGHREVHGGAGGLQAAGRGPVGHHQAVPAPLVLEHVAQQRRLGHRVAVDLVVGGHHGPRMRLGDDLLERRQVELAQRALVHAGVEREALGLRVVGHEVLDGRADARALEAVDVGDADPRGQVRVLAEALEVAAAVGRAVQVDRRREQHVDALAAALRGEQVGRGARPAPRPTRRPAPSARARWPTGRARPSARRAPRPGRPR